MDKSNFIVRGLKGETVFRKPGSLNGYDFVIDSCVDCKIYILDWTAQIQIDDCVDCTIFLGPIAGSGFFRDCKNCTIEVACEQFRTRDIHDCTIGLYCNSNPIIETSSNVTFRCWMGAYPGLAAQFAAAQLDPLQNTWYKIYDFNARGGAGDMAGFGGSQGEHMRTMDLDEYPKHFIQVTPPPEDDAESPPCENPVVLPDGRRFDPNTEPPALVLPRPLLPAGAPPPPAPAASAKNQPIGFDPKASVGFDPKRSIGFDPKASVGFNPKASIGFDPKASVGFDPKASIGFDPKASVGFDPKAAIGFDPKSKAPSSKPGKWQGIGFDPKASIGFDPKASIGFDPKSKGNGSKPGKWQDPKTNKTSIFPKETGFDPHNPIAFDPQISSRSSAAGSTLARYTSAESAAPESEAKASTPTCSKGAAAAGEEGAPRTWDGVLAKPAPMQYRPLGTTGMSVSAVSLGCFAFGGDKETGSHLGSQMAALHSGVWGPQAEEDTFAAVKAALDAGVNFFDNAEMYGDGYAEEVMGRALRASGYERSSYHVATKVSESHLAPELVKQHLEASLARMRLDYVDLYQIHWHSRAAVRTAKYPARPLEEEVPLEATLAALEELKAAGKVRHVGVCNFGVQDLRRALATGTQIVSNQICYNLLWRGIEDEVVPFCREHGIAILAWSPLAQGLLTGKVQSADEVPAGRQRSRLFSAARPQQRHGEAGLEAETFRALRKMRWVAERLQEPLAGVALAWARARPGITAVLMGARTASQVERNLESLGLELAPEVEELLSDAGAEIKGRLGSNLDPYEAADSSRIV